MTDGRDSRSITFYLAKELIRRVKRLAQRDRRSLSSVVTLALERGLDAMEKDQAA